MTQLTDKLYAVEVPDDATDVGWRAGQFTCKQLHTKPGEYHWIVDADDLMHDIGGTWAFLFTTKTATEEDARKVVAWIEIAGKIGYYDYMNPEPYRYLESWEESLRSLLRSKNLDPKNNYAIIEKLK